MTELGDMNIADQRKDPDLASELHRTVAQVFYAIGLEVEAALGESESQPVVHRLQKIRHLASQGSQETRLLMAGLQRSAPESIGHPVFRILMQKAKSFESQTDIPVILNTPPNTTPIPPKTSAAAIHLVAAYLDWAQDSKQISHILINFHERDNHLSLIIQDDGALPPDRETVLSLALNRGGGAILDQAEGSIEIRQNDDAGLYLKVDFPNGE
jgi:signal transduction histidine kinase